MDAVEMKAQSQTISILPINGTQFTPGKKIIFELSPDLAFMKASRDESYLVFTVKNPSVNRWMFATSGQSLIRQVDIFSMGTGQQVESLQQYNKMMWLLDQYTKVNHSIEQSYEGLRSDVTSLEMVDGVNRARLVSSDGEPQNVMNSIISPIQEDGSPVFLGWQVCVPLKAGIFSCFQEEKLTPIMALEGLRIELTLEDKALVCVPLQPLTANGEVRIVQPTTLALDVNAANSATFTVTGGASADLVPGQLVHMQSTVVAVTERTIISVTAAGADATVVLDEAIDMTGGADPVMITALPISNAGALNTVDVANITVEQSGLAVGQAITLSKKGGGDFSQARNITALAAAGANLRITFDGAAIDFSGANAPGAMLCLSETQWDASTYEIESVEYRVQQVMVTKAIIDKIEKGIQYSFRTWNLFFDSIPAASRRHQVEVQSVASMAKSMWTQFERASLEQNPNMPEYYSGATPDDLKINSVQYFINNKLFPLRSYDPRLTEDRPQQFNEVQKAFSAMGMPAKSFGIAEGQNLDGYSNTYLACRELARGQYVYRLRDSEPSIRLGFSGARSEIVRVNTFVWSEHIVRNGPSGMSIVL